jgi:hypothetical protein
VRALSGDEQIRPRAAFEERDDVVEALDLLEAADEQEVRSRMGRSDRRGDAGLGIGEKVRQHVHLRCESELAMLVAAELTHRDERVDVGQLRLHESAPAVELRRPPVADRAAQTFFAGAELATMPPQHVHGANQPMLVGHVELHRITVPEDPGTPDQRNVVIDDHFESPLFEKLPQASAVNYRRTELMGQERGQRPQAAAQRDGFDARLGGNLAKGSKPSA